MSVSKGWRSKAWALAAAAAVLALLASGRSDAPRAVLPAVEAEAFAALGGRSPASMPELWERLKAMGVAAVVLREETAAELAQRGEVLHFSRAEVEKWKALGLVAPGGGPKPDSLWAKDAKALSRLSGALAARGIDVSTAPAAAGGRALELPPGVELARVPAGFDPETVAVVSAAGLIPVAASTAPYASVAGHRLWLRRLPLTASRPQLLRAAHGRPMRLLVLRPAPGAGLEESLEALREALKTVRAAGHPAVLDAAAPPRDVPGWERWARLLLLYLVGLAGPLLAARAGLGVERAVRGWITARAPIASPVPEAASGMAAAWAVAAAAGFIAAVAAPQSASEAAARSWTLWTLAAPMAVGAAALFGPEGAALRARWRAPLRLRDVAGVVLLAGAVALLLAPRTAVRVAGLWESLDKFSAAADALWWWPWRWREILVGAPSLTLALILIGRREQAAKDGCETCVPRLLGDARGWLILGLLAPAGATAAVGAGGVPAALAAAQGAGAAAIGLVLGLALAGLRARVEEWVFGPSDTGLLT